MPFCYDVDTEPLAKLESIAADQMNLWREFQGREGDADIESASLLISAFVDAFECILKIDFRIMLMILETHRNREHLQRFLGVFEIAQRNSLDTIRRSVEIGLKEWDMQLVELAPAVVLSGTGPELTATAEYLESTRGSVEPQSHAATAETVTNSVKELLKRHIKFKPLEGMLHALDEVLQLIHGTE